MSKEYLAINKKDLEKIGATLASTIDKATFALDAIGALLGGEEQKKPRKKRAKKTVEQAVGAAALTEGTETSNGEMTVTGAGAQKLREATAPKQPKAPKLVAAPKQGGFVPPKAPAKGNGARPSLPGAH